MATSKSIIASPVLLFAAVAVLMLAAACTTTEAAPAPAPAPARGSNSCPAGFRNYLDLTDYARQLGREVLMIVDPRLLPVVGGILALVPHTGLKFCVCFQTNNANSALPIGCIAY